jgi:F-type H+-transporting ATPase subunit gamma
MRHKIAGAEDLQSVVRSMKALAASSIGQYESATVALEAYDRTVSLGLAACVRHSTPAISSDRAGPTKRPNVGAVVFGSDQGLVGNFNEVVADFFHENCRTFSGATKRVWAVGQRAQAILLETSTCTVEFLPVPTSVDRITPLVRQILIEVESARAKGEVWEIYIFHNQPKEGSLYEPVYKRLLPLDDRWQEKLIAAPWPTKAVPEIMGGVDSVLADFIRGYLFVSLFQACAESLASENASRLAAMQRAEKNIADMLDNLNGTLHRMRQESIDEELFDVISGFEALTKNTNA